MRFRSKEGARHSVRRIQGLSQIESSVVTLQAFLLTNSAKLAGFGRVTTERSNGRTQQGTHFSALARTDSAEFGKLENRSAARPLGVRIPPPPQSTVLISPSVRVIGQETRRRDGERVCEGRPAHQSYDPGPRSPPELVAGSPADVRGRCRSPDRRYRPRSKKRWKGCVPST
jgi:hypothetical protein